MSEDIIDHETQISAQSEQLLQRQQMLQDEARQVLEELDLVALLSKGGVLRKTGSSVLGLMVWRDIDLAVSSPGLSITRAYEVMHPLLTHPRVTQVRYFHQSDHFKEDDMDERLFFMVYYHLYEQAEWKIDISFWLGEGLHPEPVHEAVEQQLTPETRLTILQIKTAWYQLPAYRTTVASTDIYDAVLQHGVRTLAEFDQYLIQRGKPPRA
ncbi:MAG TPA: hypothetical protein VL485_03255 [Ktedonobacteraceae bacterium]|nr:hypothetical protein [Ktedonobacteraceae bacterium]